MTLPRDILADSLTDRASLQDYSPKPVIEDVRFLPLRRFVDDGGSFMELGRLNDGLLADLPGFTIKQISYSTMQPGTIKAFHLHTKQSELWFIPPHSRLLLGLYDVRRESKNQGVSMRFVMGDGQSRLLFIPKGVAHGAANLGQELGQIIYFMDQQFSPHPDDSDELRLPWDILGSDFWATERG